MRRTITLAVLALCACSSATGPVAVEPRQDPTTYTQPSSPPGDEAEMCLEPPPDEVDLEPCDE